REVTRIAEKIQSSLKEPFLVNGQQLHITASIGISIYPDDGDDAEALLKNADAAMYQAKDEGRNNYQFYSPAINVRTLERIILENRLRQALERQELEVHYQPLVDLATRRVVCAEALVRWRHPELGLLDPVRFIQLAEEIGLIADLDEWVLRTACAQNKVWQEKGHRTICVSVNFSSGQFQQSSLQDKVGQVLRETELSPELLGIEITESIAMQDTNLTLRNLAGLTDMGINFSIDDFGTGYSSLSYLKRMPLHKLKIDKSFIRGLVRDPDDEAIVNAVIAMAHSLKLKVIAEGVETMDQLSLLHSRGCDEIQGYLYSRPVPAEKLEELLGEILPHNRH
nr:bifunctional diguanylate cyclase/phosphodiesterase [Desulfobacteraceae bacterium]